MQSTPRFTLKKLLSRTVLVICLLCCFVLLSLFGLFCFREILVCKWPEHCGEMHRCLGLSTNMCVWGRCIISLVVHDYIHKVTWLLFIRHTRTQGSQINPLCTHTSHSHPVRCSEVQTGDRVQERQRTAGQSSAKQQLLTLVLHSVGHCPCRGGFIYITKMLIVIQKFIFKSD